jgi:hypothetical protein
VENSERANLKDRRLRPVCHNSLREKPVRKVL